ncbi:Uncharacterised protein [Mycobacteroides abscessus subsp. abscessus]|nr:Uncharacterised protein [Mycobacteroides abscessus subsp. abscessus]
MRSPARKVDSRAACATSRTSSGLSARSTVMPPSSSARWVVEPIGICHGLNSAYSPRIVTRVRNGNRHISSNENMFRQLPTPLLCISNAERTPPSQAPAVTPTPSSSVVSTTSVMSGSAIAARIA